MVPIHQTWPIPFPNLGQQQNRVAGPWTSKLVSYSLLLLVSFSLFEGIRISNLCIGNSLILEK